MNLLVCNCGSSSLSWKIFQSGSFAGPELVAAGKAHRVGVRCSAAPFLEFSFPGEPEEIACRLPDHGAAIRAILSRLEEKGADFQAVGHRIVHGGGYFSGPALLTEESLEKLRRCRDLAPIHTPAALGVIEEISSRCPGIPQFMAFDTAFHGALPPAVSTYALAPEVAGPLGLRKYGFHGLSYEYVSGEAARFLNRPLSSLRLVICHLGTGGSSAAAVSGGRSLDTSMGFSPLPGLIMSTRCGDIDPEAVLALIRSIGSPDEVSRILNHRSGLLGLSGFSADLRDIVARRAADPRAALAFDAYIHRLKLYIGGYIAVLGGADALIFTDGVGAEIPEVRWEACRGLECLGVRLDPELNRRFSGTEPAEISEPSSPVSVLIVPTDEELVIARQGLRLLAEKKREEIP